MAVEQSFDIEELTGDRRAVSLEGRCLPHPPITFDGLQRSDKTMYPGNRIGTIQVQGPDEGPFTISGNWSNRYIGDPLDGTHATNEQDVEFTDIRDLVTHVDSIRKQGQLIKLTWDIHVRVGILKRFRQSWMNTDEMTWEMEFEISATQENALETVVRSKVDWGSIARELSDSFDLVFEQPFFLDLPDVNILDFLAGLLDSIGNALDFIQNAINDIEDGIQAWTNKILRTFEMAGKFVALLGQVIDRTKEAIRFIERRAAVTAVQFTNDVVASATSVMSLTKQQRRVMTALKDMQTRAVDTLENVSKQIDPTMKAVVVAGEGDTLRTISQDQYGTAEHWTVLKKFNGFKSSELNTGDVVYCPNHPESLFAEL